jgi:hypothetical protein
MQQTNDPQATSSVRNLLASIRANLDSSVAIATQGLAEAQRLGDQTLERFFGRCLECLRDAQDEARALPDPARQNGVHLPAPSEHAPGEQVSTATFAAGDGANDAEVIPEEARGKPGNWPAN